jgi:nitric oxide reductase NorE protein
VTSSLLLALAVRSAHRGELRTARWLVAGTIALGLAFAVVKVADYAIEVESGHTLSTNAFFMYYFVITGIHLLHLIVGVIALTVIVFGLRGVGDPGRNRIVFECGASYWHLIDLLWMFIFPLLYLAR